MPDRIAPPRHRSNGVSKLVSQSRTAAPRLTGASLLRPCSIKRAVVYRSLNLRQVELRPAHKRATVPWICGTLEAAQAMDCEAHQMRSPQGQTAILEGKDHVPTI